MGEIERFAFRTAKTLVPDHVELDVVVATFAAVSLVAIPLWATSVAHKKRRPLVTAFCSIVTIFTALVVMLLCVSIGMNPRTRASFFRRCVGSLILSAFAACSIGAALVCFFVCGFALFVAIPWLFERPMRIAKLYGALAALFVAYMFRNTMF